MLWWIQSNVNPKIKILKPKNIGQRRLNIYFDALYPYIILNPITFIICWKCVLKSNSKLGHLHLKVSSTSIATFRTSLVILPYFVWISSKIFLFFNVSHKSLTFITWNLIEYLHTQDFQRAMAHLNVWKNIFIVLLRVWV